jgi:hypothetical protein
LPGSDFHDHCPVMANAGPGRKNTSADAEKTFTIVSPFLPAAVLSRGFRPFITNCLRQESLFGHGYAALRSGKDFK